MTHGGLPLSEEDVAWYAIENPEWVAIVTMHLALISLKYPLFERLSVFVIDCSLAFIDSLMTGWVATAFGAIGTSCVHATSRLRL